MRTGEKIISVLLLIIIALLFYVNYKGIEINRVPSQNEQSEKKKSEENSEISRDQILKEKKTTKQLPNKKQAGEKPDDYFPTAVGTRWKYEIEIGEHEPLRYQTTFWPKGEKEVCMVTTGRFAPLLEKNHFPVFNLELAVERTTSNQGPKLKYRRGVELKIMQDDLGIFENHEEVFWAISESGIFRVEEVVTYSPSTYHLSPLDVWDTDKKGYSRRIFFFIDEPFTMLSMGIKDPDDSGEIVVFFGPDNKCPSFKNEPCLQILRCVYPEKKNMEEILEMHKKQHPETPQEIKKDLDLLAKSFAERMWFAKGKGLVKLVQSVDDKISMEWTLKEFFSPQETNEK